MCKKGFFYDLLALAILVFFTTVFFAQVFFPPGYFVAGDFGGSDFTDFFIPVKAFLSQSFKEGKFAFWTEKTGGGFPLLGEGQIQNFYPGSLLFLFLPFVWAFNLNLFLAILGIGVTTYFLGKTLNLGRTSSLFASLAFAFSGPFILNLKHLPILTSAVWLPLELTLCYLFFSKKDRFFLTLLTFCFAFQTFSSSPQITLLSLCASGLLFLILSFPQRPKEQKALISSRQIKGSFSPLFLFCLVVSLGIGLGAVQALPSWEAKSVSTRTEPFLPTQTRQFALTPRALITFVIPFALANPAHPPAYDAAGPLFWETCGYIGLLTLILAVGGIFFLKKTLVFHFLFLLGLFSLLLSFGANIPIGLIHKLPLLNAFRVPGRFLILTDLSLALLAASFLGSLLKKSASYQKLLAPLLGLGALAFLMADLIHFGLFYNESVPACLFENPPKTARFLENKTSRGRVLSLGASFVYEKIYKTNRGWRNLGEKYLLYNEMLPANYNLFWDISGSLSYSGMKVKTANEFENLVLSRFQILDPKEPTNLDSEGVKNLFLVGNIKYVVTPFIIEDKNFVKIFEEKTDYRDFKIRIYEFREEVKRAFFVHQAEFVAGEVARQQRLLDPAFNPKEKVLVETPTSQPSIINHQSSIINKLTVIQSSNEEVIINIETKDSGFLVLSDTFYPGWKAFVNSQEAEILRANHTFRAVSLTKGKHQVRFVYQPESLKKGVIISLISFGLWLSLLLAFLLSGKLARPTRKDNPIPLVIFSKRKANFPIS